MQTFYDHRYVIFTGAAVAFFIYAFNSGLLDMLFWFMVVGIIPGTDIRIPPLAMLIAYMILGIAIVVWAFRKELYLGSPKVVRAHKEANKKAVMELNRKINAEKRKQQRLTPVTQSRRERVRHKTV